jgi:hypothetical protein
MNSTPTPKAVGTRNSMGVRADEHLARAYEHIAGVDEQLVRLSEQVAKIERDSSRTRSAGSGPRLPSGKPAFRALVGLPLAACIVVAALVLQSSYGDGARPAVDRGAPQSSSTPSLPLENPPVSAQPALSTVQVTAAEAAPQTAVVAQAAPQDAAPTATAALPDHAQLLQTMARDLADMQRNIEQLRANQQQIARDNSKAIEELKASQEEIKRALAKVSEQSPPKTLPPSTQPPPALRKPERTLQSPHSRARPRIRRDWIYEDDW